MCHCEIRKKVRDSGFSIQDGCLEADFIELAIAQLINWEGFKRGNCLSPGYSAFFDRSQRSQVR